LSHPTAPPAAGGCRVEVLGGSWTRIQLTIRLRVVDGEPVDPATVRLMGPQAAREDGVPDRSTEWFLVPPARAWHEDGELRVRINPMQGPDRDPLTDGRWELLLADPGRSRADRDVPVRRLLPSVASGSSGAIPGSAFSLARGRYTVTPVVDPGSSIALDIRLGPPDALPAPDAAEAPEVDPAASSTVPSPTAGRLSVSRPIRQLRPWAFRALFRLFRAVTRRTGRRILFTSDSRAELGGNLKIVYDRMVERGLDRDYELLTLFKESLATRRALIDRLRLPWLLARADVIVLDDYQPVIYRVDDPDIRIVQLWHAWGAFKTVGYSRVGKPGGLSPWSRAHKNYTDAIVSSDSEVPFYAEAFGIPEASIRPTGIPRMDGFWDPERAARSRELALEAYPAARGRFVILFAPTFRGHGMKTATYPVELMDWAALHALCVEKDAVCIIRLHPFVQDRPAIPPAFADRIIDGATSSIDINDVLFAADLLVTDYSSVVFEFSTRDKPMLFFAFDLEEYIATRDFYVDYEAFVPGRIVRTFEDLLDAIRREDYAPERLAAFRQLHLGHFDGRATDRVIDVILGR
jgi:CDP-ribitol ribitolphosphotransferase / teichoic acid ribitol-phosphate polymerase